MELQGLSKGLSSTRLGSRLPRKVIFERRDDYNWSLRWIWIFDPCLPDFSLITEHLALTFDGRNNYSPFSEHLIKQRGDNEPKRTDIELEVQFSKRMANKARKERARTG
jgi:hypothetical protein